ncbi:hypothetical protein [Leptothoe sp. PORK10 BA2]|uniref:hypothetical protein n=1 Tax=Leptothoe sp. PORK10 BA2 TaxID=3110254 RepID=UPI002B212DEF|nr:hypothetical protein [Leptothoe sp. PORK10 BA2]MEA5463652.1 hypothetical protein [Leptothoe sp. PORK10 BA2]
MSTTPKLISTGAATANSILQLLKRLITSSYGVAAIASLSFHGAMFAAAPRFFSASFAAFGDDGGTAEERTVPLVTLSPAEQGRLPNFNLPSVPPIPNFPSVTSSGSLPNATSLTLPGASAFNRSSNSNLFDRNGNRTNRSSVGSLNNRRLFNNPHRLATTNPPSRSGQSSNGRTARIRNIPPPPGDIGQRTERNLEAELEVERRAAAAAAARAEAEAAAADAPGLEPLPDQSEGGAETGAEREPSGSGSEDIASNGATADGELTALERLQAKFKYDPADTSTEEANASYTAWLTPSADESEPTDEDEPEAEIPTAAEAGVIELESLNLCVEKPPQNGLVGVQVAPDGTPDEPIIFLSTGYDYLNQAALDQLSQAEFPATETPVRYPFEVKVSYDAETCQSSADIINTAQN